VPKQETREALATVLRSEDFDWPATIVDTGIEAESQSARTDSAETACRADAFAALCSHIRVT